MLVARVLALLALALVPPVAAEDAAAVSGRRRHQLHRGTKHQRRGWSPKEHVRAEDRAAAPTAPGGIASSGRGADGARHSTLGSTNGAASELRGAASRERGPWETRPPTPDADAAREPGRRKALKRRRGEWAGKQRRAGGGGGRAAGGEAAGAAAVRAEGLEFEWITDDGVGRARRMGRRGGGRRAAFGRGAWNITSSGHHPLERLETSQAGAKAEGLVKAVNFATLDLTCLVGRITGSGGLMTAPALNGGRVAKYLRRKNPNPPHQRFLVALYMCEDGYQFDDPIADRLFCSNNSWTGTKPRCLHIDEVKPETQATLDGWAEPDPCKSEETADGQSVRKRCDHSCTAVDGKAICSCYKGYRLDPTDGRTCRDIDECEESTHNCEKICFNRPGSFKCSCPAGLRLSGDDKTCVDVNECLLRNGHGPCQDTCENTHGSYVCGCGGITGTRLSSGDSHSCEDIDECEGGAAGCSHGCVNTFGAAFCTCPDGFLLGGDWKTCQDIDECAEMEVSGSGTMCEHGCLNTLGSYQCLELTTTTEGSGGSTPESSPETPPGSRHPGTGEGRLSEQQGVDFASSGGAAAGRSGKEELGHEEERGDGGTERNDESGAEKEEGEEDDEDGEEEEDGEKKEDGDDYAEENDEDEEDDEEDDEEESEDGDETEEEAPEKGRAEGENAEYEGPRGEKGEVVERAGEEGKEGNSTGADGGERKEEDHKGGEEEAHTGVGEQTPAPGETEIPEVTTIDATRHRETSEATEPGGETGRGHDGANLEMTTKSTETTVNSGAEGMHTEPGANADGEGSRAGGRDGGNGERPEGDGNSGSKRDGGEDREGGSGEEEDETGDEDEGDEDEGDDEDEGEEGNGEEDEEEDEEAEGEAPASGGEEGRRVGGGRDGRRGEEEEEANEIPTGEIDTGDAGSGEVNQVTKGEGPDERDTVDGRAGGRGGAEDHEKDEDEGQESNEIDGDGEAEEPKIFRLPFLCHDGYRKVNKTDVEDGYAIEMCEDIDECDEEDHDCAGICINTPGSYRCACTTGYVLKADTNECKDIDECSEADGIIKHTCSHGCINVIGSYRCSCPEGYTLTQGGGVCEDINECDAGSNCSHICINIPGSYDCDCPEGLELAEDVMNCEDIDECRLEISLNCSHSCVNTFGSFRCECQNGFTSRDDGMTCDDIDECSVGNPCDHECANTFGGYQCLCRDGYELSRDGRSCKDVDECKGGHLCSHKCLNFEGGYSCECPSGYNLKMDNRTCQDVNECQETNFIDQMENTVSISGDCSHICENTEGSYVCRCPEGYELIEDGKTCEDINECDPKDYLDRVDSSWDYDEEERREASLSGPCSHMCVNLLGHFRCECPTGYVLSADQRTCDDVDECMKDNGGCSHLCANYEGSSECACPPGHYLSGDGKTCLESDMCKDSANNGGCSHECHNLLDGRGVRCGCPHGFRLASDDKTCEDVDECAVGGEANCSHACVNALGGFRCECPEGFRLNQDDAKTCEDMDECAEGSETSCEHGCLNTHGSFACTCKAGYHLTEDGTSCADVNECLENNGGCSHQCTNTDGGHLCSCPEGLVWKGKGKCTDIDECAEDNGGCSTVCHNTIGSYRCGCPKGYMLHRDEKSCADVDECSQGNGGCPHICINTIGSFHCNCRQGFRLSRRRSYSRDKYPRLQNHRGRHMNSRYCEDIDECESNNGGCSHRCVNTHGSYRCVCPEGFYLNATYGGKLCTDVDECSVGNTKCSQRCVNTAGSYLCECGNGFRLHDGWRCDDIDECDEKNPCTHSCVNIPGSYRCICPVGYKLEFNECQDIDECKTQNLCSHGCLNTLGSYYCTCPIGFSVNGSECIDVDECTRDSPCSHGCINTRGGYQCTCPTGYAVQGNTCYDIDECKVDNPCSHECINTPGSYKCECPPGYRQVGKICQDIDECDEYNPCGYHCRNIPGNYQCLCPRGHRLYGQECRDINECIEEKPCSHACVNTVGSYRCSCPSGYRLQGKTCLEVMECPKGMRSKGGHCVAEGCPVMASPSWGELHCSPEVKPESAGIHLAIGTKCVVRCRLGFKSVASPSVMLCTSEGTWASETSTSLSPNGNDTCIPMACPRLKPPLHGRLVPDTCSSGKSFQGQRCMVICRQGYHVTAGNPVITCVSTNNSSTPLWSPVTITRCVRDSLRPFIQCPPNMKLTLPGQQSKMHVRIAQPKSNMEWSRYIDSVPAWGKHLEAELSPGTTIVTFYARSPMSNITAMCRLFIEILDLEAPHVSNCPRSFEIQLEPGETSKAIFWKEPVFKDNIQVKSVQQSRHPGEFMAIGIHRVTYVATDESGNTAHCHFVVHVKGAEVGNHYMSFKSPQKVFICPHLKQGQVIHVYPWQVPIGCHPIRSRRPTTVSPDVGLNSLSRNIGHTSHLGKHVTREGPRVTGSVAKMCTLASQSILYRGKNSIANISMADSAIIRSELKMMAESAIEMWALEFLTQWKTHENFTANKAGQGRTTQEQLQTRKLQRSKWQAGQERRNLRQQHERVLITLREPRGSTMERERQGIFHMRQSCCA